MTEANDFLERRNIALRDLDMDYARAVMPNASSDEVRLIAMHKARYECTEIFTDLRQASERWLKERQYKRLGNLDWPTSGELPR
jgi:hypothetical protein